MKLYPVLTRNGFIIGIIACLLIAGIPAAMAADGTTSTPAPESNITVMSLPAGATVFLNGEFRGITPVKIGNLPPGEYLVDVSLAGYKNETITRTLNEGSMLEIGITQFEPLSKVSAPTGSGSIAVDSSPGGAFVALDGKPVGQTPTDHAALILNDVPSGSHTLTVELAGYLLSTSNVTVVKNRVVQVNADLETQSPAIAGTPVATTDRRQPVPLSPLTAIAAAGLAGLLPVLRRS
jgi:hypothetical protein